MHEIGLIKMTSNDNFINVFLSITLLGTMVANKALTAKCYINLFTGDDVFRYSMQVEHEVHHIIYEDS